MGFYHGWAWSWPLNRRVMYNRASADPNGKAWDPSRPGIEWDVTDKRWKGDVPDYPPTMDPKDPKRWGPLIMNGEGVGRLFSSSMLDGPFPEHYEPVESPVENPLHPKQSESPVVFLYDKQGGRENRFGTAKEYPVHRDQLPADRARALRDAARAALVGLQPSPFVEIPEEVPKEKGIQTGDRVRVSSKRGKLEVLGGRDQAAGAASRSTAKRSTTSGSRSTGASSASPPTGTRPRAPTGSPTR